MDKVKLGAATFLYPLPVALVGARVDEAPNYLTVASLGVVQHEPPILSVSLRRTHYTNRGIRRTGCFSINIPRADMVEVVDYCGIVSGRCADKSALFTTFYGQLEEAPMAAECPLNMECKLLQILDYGGDNELFVGQVVQAYAEAKYLLDGVPDPTRMNPLAFTIHDNNYWRLGDHAGVAWEIGRCFKPPAD